MWKIIFLLNEIFEERIFRPSCKKHVRFLQVPVNDYEQMKEIAR